MATEQTDQIVYLVTGGMHDDYAEIAVVSTPEIAQGMVSTMNAERGYGMTDYTPMPLLTTAPRRVTTYTYQIRLDAAVGWDWDWSDDSDEDPGYQEFSCWDFQMEKENISWGLTVRSRHSEVRQDRQKVTVTDQNRENALEVARAMMTMLQTESGRGRPE